MNDILHGRDMQMLIYLFALEKFGSSRYGIKPEPAGVLYVPARDVILNASRNATGEEIEKLRTGEMRRSGLILNDNEIIEAMEMGAVKEYLPVKTTKEGILTGDSLVSSKQIALLGEHIGGMMSRAKQEIKSGKNECTPYFKNENNNACSFCQYHAVCGFDEELGDKRRFAPKMKIEDVWKAMGGL